MKFFRYFFLFLTLVGSNLLIADENPQVSLKMYTPEEAHLVTPVIDLWVQDHFKHFPYLYQGIPSPHTIFSREAESFVLFGTIGSKYVGLIAGCSLNSDLLIEDYFIEDIRKDTLEKGYDPEKVLYVNFFLIDPSMREDIQFIQSMYSKACEKALEMGKTHLCYMEVVREKDHPLRPASYTPIEPWEDLDTSFDPLNIRINISWPTLQIDGSVREELNTMDFYIQEIK